MRIDSWWMVEFGEYFETKFYIIQCRFKQFCYLNRFSVSNNRGTANRSIAVCGAMRARVLQYFEIFGIHVFMIEHKNVKLLLWLHFR